MADTQAPTHRARKRFGQNFLHDQAVINDIINAIYPRPGDHLVEIGPGQAALTQPIIDSSSQLHDIKLDLVELDRDLVAGLQQRFASLLQNPEQLQIHQGDALDFDFSRLLVDNATNTRQPLRIFGNLPYNISTPLIFHLLAFASAPSTTGSEKTVSDMHFMLQKEVVNRMTAAPGSKAWGRLSVMTQYQCFAEPLFDVAPEAFTPQPKVTSSIIRLTPYGYNQKPHSANNDKTLEAVVKAAFAQRRKTLRNTLKGLIDAEQLIDIDIDPARRAETLSVSQFIDIANVVHRLSSSEGAD